MSNSKGNHIQIRRGMCTRAHRYPGRIVLRYEFMSESDLLIGSLVVGLGVFVVLLLGILYAGGFTDLLNPFFLLWNLVISFVTFMGSFLLGHFAWRGSYRSAEIIHDKIRFRESSSHKSVFNRWVSPQSVFVFHGKYVGGDGEAIGDVAFLGSHEIQESCWVPVSLSVTDRKRSEVMLGPFKIKVSIKEFDCTEMLNQFGIQSQELDHAITVQID